MIHWDKSGAGAAFVASFLGQPDFGKCITACVLDADGSITAGVVFHDWNPDKARISASLAAAHSRWITRRRVVEIFDYPFHVLGVKILHGATENPRVVRIFKALGGNVYHINGLHDVVTLDAEQWARVKKERLNG